MSKILVTSALPYANGDIHIGHLVEYIQSDIFVRYLKISGENAVYMCASDTHGTPIEINARKQGISPEEMVARFNERHFQDFTGFQIHFDRFYTTHSEETRVHAENIFNKLNKNGLIEIKEVEQYYCDHDKRFLPDRFVKGTCPKCGAEDQYGDNCEKCGATYDTVDVKHPRCSLCGNPPALKNSTHYFVLLEKARDIIEKWVNDKTHLHSEVQAWLTSNFLSGELRPWDISRDSPYFGFKIPGEEDKFFYVWMDAPVGYIGTTQKYCDENGLDFNDYWSKESDTKIFHIIGKDITYFHTLFWPAMLAYGEYKMPHRVHIHGFLTVNGEKMSKSRGTSVKASTYLEFLDPQYLRFYYASKLGPTMDDIDLNLEEFRLRVNAELVNKIANLASRSMGIINKKLNSVTGTTDPECSSIVEDAKSRVESISRYYGNFEFSKAIREICIIAENANRYLQDTEPFRYTSSDPEKARRIITSALGLLKGITILIGPVLPEFKKTVEKMLGAPHSWTFRDLDFILPPDIKLGNFERLIERVDEKNIEAMIAKTKEAAPSVQIPLTPLKDEIAFDDFQKIDLRAGKIIDAQLVKGAGKLLQLTVDIGIEKRNVFAGIKAHFSPEELIGKTVVVCVNLKPRKMKFGISEAMVLACEDPSGHLGLLVPQSGDKGFYPGSQIS
ncbi:MAG: methionine--tRNA ligase [Deltaproteobacteria bacterium]|nr:methionine--tRNA ligase [Deltaproteobacteria bacterium]